MKGGILEILPLDPFADIFNDEISFFYGFIFLIVPLIFLVGIIRLRTKSGRDKYIKNFFEPSAEQKIRDYSTFKTFLYASVVMLSICMIINLLLQLTLADSTDPTSGGSTNSTKTNLPQDFYNSYNIIYAITDSFTFAQIFFTLILVYSVNSFLPSLFITDLKYSFAKQCSMIAFNKEDVTEKAKYNFPLSIKTPSGPNGLFPTLT